MPDSFKFSILAVLVFCFGVLGTSAYAEEVKAPSCTKEKSAKEAGYSIHYKKFQSDMFDANGKEKSPFSAQTMNDLGDRGLKLTDIEVGTSVYIYWFLCKEQFNYQVLNPATGQGVMLRLNQLVRLGWEHVATVTAHGERWFYLVKPVPAQ